jgi:hypothetical protein
MLSATAESAGRAATWVGGDHSPERVHLAVHVGHLWRYADPSSMNMTQASWAEGTWVVHLRAGQQDACQARAWLRETPRPQRWGLACTPKACAASEAKNGRVYGHSASC